jgi:hypothetical protein
MGRGITPRIRGVASRNDRGPRKPQRLGAIARQGVLSLDVGTARLDGDDHATTACYRTDRRDRAVSAFGTARSEERGAHAVLCVVELLLLEQLKHIRLACRSRRGEAAVGRRLRVHVYLTVWTVHGNGDGSETRVLECAKRSCASMAFYRVDQVGDRTRKWKRHRRMLRRRREPRELVLQQQAEAEGHAHDDDRSHSVRDARMRVRRCHSLFDKDDIDLFAAALHPRLVGTHGVLTHMCFSKREETGD